MSTKKTGAKEFAVDDAVTWVSSSVSKTGTVIAVIPAGSSPASHGFGNHGFSTIPRRETSYIVRGWRTNNKKSGAGIIYWPLTSLLLPVYGLSEAEVDWCRANADIIRACIAKHQN